MRIVADAHISPRTVEHLRGLGYDVVRVSEVMLPSAPDEEILAFAGREARVVLSQDLDFSRLVALGRLGSPSVISLRLASSRVEHVIAVLERTLPNIVADVAAGAIVTVEDARIRKRKIPIE